MRLRVLSEAVMSALSMLGDEPVFSLICSASPQNIKTVVVLHDWLDGPLESSTREFSSAITKH
uniref:Uncharacterized protein n=1 Tax=Nelumbo nucifera TaxID=4432 RepID=A0A822ZGW6_NELNU|nr:TPA_asm: hypothetical protein HUJ06_000939 [Nelumbo nucifera]